MSLEPDRAAEADAGWLSLVCLRCNLIVGVAVAGGCASAAEETAGTDAANGSVTGLGLPLRMNVNAVVSLSLHLSLSMPLSQFVSLSETVRLRLFPAEMTADLFETQTVTVLLNMIMQHQVVSVCQQTRGRTGQFGMALGQGHLLRPSCQDPTKPL